VKPAAVIREVKSQAMSCDRVGNLLLAKFSAKNAPDASLLIPANIVFWLLRHLPVNQDPALQPPPPPPQMTQMDWDRPNIPRATSVQCREFPGTLRMTFQAENAPDLTLVLDRSNVELMRQILVKYSDDLIDLEAQ
jgi:hypothetical protein